jgi:two-component system cell cycle sensor histidine kinase/response regulator CckA
MPDAPHAAVPPPAGELPLGLRLAFALAVSGAACALTVALGPFMERNIFMLLFVAVTVSSLAGGMWAGLTATAATGLFAAVALVPPGGILTVAAAPDRVRLAMYLVVGTCIAGLAESLRAARRRAAAREAALRQQEARFRGVVEQLAEGVALTDAAGGLVYANHRFAELVGLPGPARPDGCWAALLGGPGEGEWERQVERADGTRAWLACRGSPFLDADGAAAGTLYVVHDVTARREAQAALETSEEMLRRSQKMEAVGRVTGGIAHDFNNVLSAVRLSAALLREDVPPGTEAAESVAEIEEAVERASAMVRQLLAFSRPAPPEPRAVDLNGVVTGMRRMLARLLPPEVAVETRPAPVPAVVRADPVQLEQVLLNLCVNARDAMPGGGRLTISVLAADGDGPTPPGDRPGWWLAVEDTGVGMDAATLQKVFEPFFTTKRPGQGTGLGLATVYAIVHGGGGELQVSSVPGQGTAFHVFLPAADTSASPASPAPAPVA